MHDLEDWVLNLACFWFVILPQLLKTNYGLFVDFHSFLKVCTEAIKINTNHPPKFKRAH